MWRKKVFLILIMTFAALACTFPVPERWVEIGREILEGLWGGRMTTPAPLTLYVATTGNDSNDCLSEASACQTLSVALDRSTPGSTIHIGPGEFRSDAPLLLHQDITLQGAGSDRTTIANPTGNVIQLVYSDGRREIRDLTVAGAGWAAGGHGINIPGGLELILENCHIRDNYYGISIGAGARATIRNCTVEDNQEGIENNGDLGLYDSTLRDNAREEGAAFSNRGSGTATIENTIIDSNGIATGRGAATVAVSNQGGVLTMNGGSVSNNAGYGVVIWTGDVTLSGVTVNGNAFAGIWHVSGATTVNSGIVQNNGAYGIRIGESNGVDLGRISISRTAITGNRGAGLRIDGGESIHVMNTTISGNTATSARGGGGIWGYGGNLRLLDSTVAYNTGRGLDLPAGAVAEVIVRRSVIALNSGEECQVDPRITFDASTFATYVCNESWTQETLKLRPLVAEAGTFVHPIDADSPLVDAGDGPPCPEVDQRGFGRPAGRTCDVGAYEYGATSTSAAIVIATPGPPDIIPLVTDTPTPTQGVPMVRFIKNAFCRKGPGTVYDVVTGLEQGNEARAEGRNEQNTWWWILLPNSTAHCWVSDVTVEKSGPFDQLPIIPEPPTPTPSPTPAPVPGCYVYDQQKNPVCTVPCPPNALPGGACTP